MPGSWALPTSLSVLATCTQAHPVLMHQPPAARSKTSAVDAPSLALIIPVVHRGLRDRSGERQPQRLSVFLERLLFAQGYACSPLCGPPSLSSPLLFVLPIH